MSQKDKNEKARNAYVLVVVNKNFLYTTTLDFVQTVMLVKKQLQKC